MRAYVSGLLGDRFEVEAVADGEAALAAARAHPPDLVLSDVMMPKLDGFGLLQALRADSVTCVKFRSFWFPRVRVRRAASRAWRRGRTII